MGSALLTSMMVMQDTRQMNLVKKAISIGKQHSDCPTSDHSCVTRSVDISNPGQAPTSFQESGV